MIAVTGGAGFIGTHIVHRLVSSGKEVTVIDNLFSGNKGNLSDISGKVKLFEGTAGQISGLNAIPEVIIHEGVYSSSPMYKDEPTRTANAVEDFIRLLEFARKHNVKVVYASSSSLYNGIEPPHREDAAVKVADYYTEARYSMERMAELYNKLYGVRSIGLRYFSVYGEREFYKGQYANLVSQFLWSMQKDEPPLVFGDGEQSRDFVYVEDVVDANLLAVESQIPFGIYNVGTGKETSINDMIDLLNKKLGKSIKADYKENKIKNYVARTLADTSKAKKELGFSAKVSLEQGISKLVDYYAKK